MIVTHWLDHLWVMQLKLGVVELVGKTTVRRTAEFGHLISGRLLDFHWVFHEVEAHIFTVNVMVDVSEAGYCARLVLDFLLFFKAFRCSFDYLLRSNLLSCSLKLLTLLDWLNGCAESRRVLVALLGSFHFLGLALEGFLGRGLLSLVKLVLRDRRLQLQRLGSSLSWCSLVLIFFVKILHINGAARCQ